MRLVALALLAALPLGAQAPAPPLYDSLVVRALLGEALVQAQRVSGPARSPLLSAIGRTQVTTRDFKGAARTLALVGDEPLAGVRRALGESATFAGLDRAGLARRLSCALYEDNRPGDALATVRAMRASVEREWELAHIVALTARGARSPYLKPPPPAVEPQARWRAALVLAEEIRLPEARLDALIAVTDVIPDTGAGAPFLEQAYVAARRITLADQDRQRSRDALLAIVALELRKRDDARMLFARLSDGDDLQRVIRAATVMPDSARTVRELAPRVIRAGRAIRDSAARDVYLVRLWEVLKRTNGRAFADSSLHEATWSAEHPRDLRATVDSATAADTSAVARAKRALAKLDYAEIRRQVARVPLRDRAELWADLAWEIYTGQRDTARVYMREARAALVAAPRDPAVFDERASSIAGLQFRLGSDDEGLATLNLVRNPDAARYTVSEWGKSTMSSLNAAKLRAYADRVTNPVLRDAVLARVVNGYLVGYNARRADILWGAALAESIATPDYRTSALRDVAADALRRGDATEARQRFVALLRATSDSSQQAEPIYRTLVGSVIAAGAGRDAIAWAREPASAATRAMRLRQVAEEIQRAIDQQQGKGMWFSNGPDWCRDEF
jgi:hypothetical protein